MNDSLSVGSRDEEDVVMPESDVVYVENKYTESSATATYQVLCELQIPFARIIAEYESTQYAPCMECGTLFGLIECTRDFEFDNGTVALFNEEGDVVYYLCYEPSSILSETDEIIEKEGEEYNDILCDDCGLKWRCSGCSFQAFRFNETEHLIPGGCYYCKQSVCDYCSVYINSKKIGICEKCFRDDDICDMELDPIKEGEYYCDPTHWSLSYMTSLEYKKNKKKIGNT